MANIKELYKIAKVKKLYCGWFNVGDFDTRMEYVKEKTLKDWKETCLLFLEDDKKPVREYPVFDNSKMVALEKYIFQLNLSYCSLNRRLATEFDENGKFKKHYFEWEYTAGDIGYYDEKTGKSVGEWEIIYSDVSRYEALTGFVLKLWKNELQDKDKVILKEILSK